MAEKHLYQQVVDELNAGSLDAALWAMVWTKVGGDEAKAKTRYVEARVAELRRQAQQTQRRAWLGEWRDELRRLWNDLPWGLICTVATVNLLYMLLLYYRPPNTGFLARFGALIGFNVVPLLLAGFALLAAMRWPKHAVKAASTALLIATTLMFLLNAVDIWCLSQVPPNHYRFELADGPPAWIGSDIQINRKQFDDAVSFYNREWAQRQEERTRMLNDWNQGNYWAYGLAQSSKGFLLPLKNALCQHVTGTNFLCLLVPTFDGQPQPVQYYSQD